MLALAAGGGSVPAFAARENVAADRLRLNAQAAAHLAGEAGDARAAYAALLRHYSFDPERPGLRTDVFRYAVLTGDRARATALAEALWTAGSRSLEIRAVLIADSTQRGDWRRVRELSSSTSDKVQLASDTLGDVIGGWVDLAQGARDPAANLRARIERSRDAGQFRLTAASILLAAGKDAESVAPLLTGVRTSALAVRNLGWRLVPQLRARGGDAAADALIAAMNGAQPLSRDESEMANALPAKVTSADGIAIWMSLLAASSDSPVGSNRHAALAFARAATWLAPRDGEMKLVLAGLLERDGEPALALALFDGEASRGDLPALLALRRAELLIETGKRDEGLTIATALAARAEAPIDAQLRTLTMLRTANRQDEVAALLDRLIADPSGRVAGVPALAARLRVARAEMLLAAKDWAAAKPLLDAAVTLLPEDPSILNFAGYSAIEARRDIDASFALIERAWRLDPDNAAIVDSLGWAHFLMGRADRAVALLESAAAKAPDNAVINEHLGDALWATGRRFEARYAWSAAAITAEPDMRERLAAKARVGLTVELTAP